MSDTIGFFSLQSTADKKGLLGALLVTDGLGKPEEFRVTFPVKPTLLQRQLYGHSLFPHVSIELCGKPLFSALKTKPAVLLVDKTWNLEIAKALPCPVAHVERLGDTLKVTSPSDSGGSPEAKITSQTGRFQPLAVTFPEEYSSEQQAATQELLQRFFGSIDLLEPFARIEVAVKALGEQDQRFV